MLFNSWQFLLFFPIVVLIYFLIPKRVKQLWLLAMSYYFYMCWNPRYILLILASTLLTWLSGLLLEATDRGAVRRRKWIVAGCLLLNLGLLAFFKYYDFFLANVNVLARLAHLPPVTRRFSVVLPVGISFYTFQALSYTLDVYRGEIRAERDLFKYALFVSFFPQLVAGPIERSKNLLRDIHDIPDKKLWDYDRVTRGLTVMLYGMFLKLVIADRVSPFVDAVFADYARCGGALLWLGAAGFALQIYCDFASYSTIAIGAAQVMGFTLMENFNTPYFARSIKDFWRRWHISLSTWFRDYLYFPLGGSRCSRARRYFNLMVVFLVSGLWHGAGWHFVAWGCLHGLYQVVGDLSSPLRSRVRRRLSIREESAGHRLAQVAVTFLLVTVAWVFFRADSVGQAARYIALMGARLRPGALFGGGLRKHGLTRLEGGILGAAVLVLLCFDLVRYRRGQRVDQFLAERPLWLRWGILFGILFATLIFGKYGPEFDPKAFIYFQF